jgi:ABC-type multidrug transport system fused ATPase/permease subunit
MNQQVFSKFNVYDQIGYLHVGSIGLLVIYLDTVLLNYEFPKFDLKTAIIWLIVAYFLGHIIQAVANVIIREKKEDFNQQEKRILKIAEEFYGVKELPDGEIWNLCYMTALAKDITGQISSFNAYYSLYRGWLVIFAIESMFLLIYVILFFSLSNLMWLIVSFLLAVLCYRRSKRFYKYLRTKVLQTFLIIKTLKLQ